MQRIGFVGLGIMGSGMVKNLVRKGYDVAVWNRTPARVAELGVPVRSYASPRELTQHSEVVLCCVSDPAAVERVVFADDGVLSAARAGLSYVECSTVGPDLVRRVAEAFEARGAAALEAPVTGSRLGAEQGTLLFMTGGPVAVHQALEPLLLAMGSRAIHCGASGQGALVKLVGNTLISFMLSGLCEASVAARKAGLPLERILEVVMASGFQSPYYAFKGKAIQQRDFFTHFALDLLVKDQALMLDVAAEQGVPMPALSAVHALFQQAQAQGHGQEDIAAVVKTVERAAGVTG